MISKFIQFLKKDTLLLFLIIYTITTRWVVIFQRIIPFQFDHGKDAVTVLHMFLTATPKLIGPWTSISGLFFGPGWYYFLLPGIIFLQADPIAPVVTTLLLGLITIVYVYYTFGKTEATLLTASSVFYTITTSAWNPFPMVLLTFVILGQLKRQESEKKLTVKTAIILGLATGFGFHFSTAFAVFFPGLLFLSFLFKKTKLSVKPLTALIGSFLAPFLPQLLFEIRHNFLEVKAVMTYLSTGDNNPASFQKFWEIAVTLVGEIKEVVAPSSYWVLQNINIVFQVFFFLLLSVAIFFFIRSHKYKTSYLLLDAAFWFTLPILAFTYLHFNVWYLLPLFSFSIVLLGQIIKALSKRLMVLFLALYMLMSVSKFVFFIVEDGSHLLSSTTFLANKETAIDYIYEQAGDQPFASYQFMPDIYDYPYQYIFFVHALHGDRLPTEFSYQPNEINYIPEKSDLLQKFIDQLDHREPELVFYIIEGHQDSSWYNEWWSHQKHGKIVNEQQISSELKVLTALPEAN